MTLEVTAAIAGAIFVFCLVLLIFGDGRAPLARPKNAIGFAPPSA